MDNALVSLLALLRSGVEPTSAGDNEWTPIGLYGATVEAVVVDPFSPLTVWCATNAGLHRSSDRGATWARIGEDDLPDALEDVAVGGDNGSLVYTVSQQGVYRSGNAGVNWTRVYTTNGYAGIYAIAISPLDPDLVLFGDSWGGIWRSTDGGNSWTASHEGLMGKDIREIVFAPGAPHIVYAASFGGLWKSLDWGATWSAAHGGFATPPMLYAVAVDPYDSQVLYIGTGQDGLYKSVNGGTSWTPIGTGLGTSHVATIAIDPDNQQVIYVGGGANPSSGTPGVYRSLDNAGTSWQPLMNGMGSRIIYHLFMDKANPLTLYAGTYGGAWRYTVLVGPEDYSISINDGALFTNQTDVELYLTAPSGTTEMMISDDGGFGGATWEPFSTIKPWTITSVGDYVLPRTVYAKFRTHGVISGLYQDDIVLDVTAPTGTVTVIDPLASDHTPAFRPQKDTVLMSATELTRTVYLPLTTSNFRPGYRLVGLRMSASDDLSGVDKVLVGGEPNFSGVEWQPFCAEDYWYIVDSAISVYVKFRDRAGNESSVVSESLEW